MNRPDDHARVSLSVDPGPGGVPALADEAPFCIVVLGDFSAARGAAHPDAVVPVAERRPVMIESMDDLLDRMRPTLQVDVGGSAPALMVVRALDDLHPDRLIERVPHLRELVAAIDPTVADHRATGGGPASPPAAPPQAPPSGPPPSGLLDEIVDAATEGGAAATGPLAELERWVEEVVSPHRVQSDTAEQADLRTRLEAEAAERVQAFLHAPPVRELEALLRGVLFLVAGLRDRTRVRVLALDVTRAELEQDLAGPDPQRSGLLRALLQPLPGPCAETPPCLLVGAYELGSSAADVALVNRVAMIAHVLGAPWIGAAAPDVVGLDSFDDDADRVEPGEPDPLWQAFRGTPAARSVGLVAPPFLLRLPYGPGSDPCERLPIDEVGEGGPERYLWGNPAFVCAAALADAFHEQGWALGGRAAGAFGSRPFHVRDDGRIGARPTRGAWMEAAAERARARGVMPLIAHRHEARMHLPSTSSVAVPSAALAGWWNES
jgi:type VI secretion system ImpC/EvpB family protein